MNRKLFGLAFLILGLSVTSCRLTLVHFLVPPRVMATQEFEVRIRADGVVGTSGEPACVLQLPIGFTVIDSVFRSLGGTVPIMAVATRDDPALLQNYVAEPGHYLAGFSGQVHTAVGDFKVILRAPPSPTSIRYMKISLAGRASASAPFQATDPHGVTQFAFIAGPRHAAGIQVTPQAPTPFALVTNGLLGPGTSGLPWWGAAAGDIDGDGNADIVLTQGDPRYNLDVAAPRVWLSRHGRAWTEPSQGLPIGPAFLFTYRPIVGDFDNDGFADIAFSHGQVLFGNGGTSWQAIPSLLAQYSLLGDGAAVGDIDGDGIDDLALATFAGPLVFRSNGDRSFTQSSNGLPNGIFHAGFGPLLLCDVTGDGHCDLVAAVGPRAGLKRSGGVWAGDGQGNWTATPELPVFHDMAVGDLDGDGRVELVLAAWLGGIHIYTWRGGAWATSSVAPPPEPGTVRLTLLDYDRDGWLDLVVVPGIGPMQLWRNLAGAGLSLVPESGLSLWPSANLPSIVAADVDGDSFPDLVASCWGEHPTVWRNTGSGLSAYGTGCSGGSYTMPRIGFRGT